jgi:GDP-L-fucose synthase
MSGKRLAFMGWKPRIGLEDGLRQTYRWYLDWLAAETAKANLEWARMVERI